MSKIRIVLIDEDDYSRNVFRSFLTEHGFFIVDCFRHNQFLKLVQPEKDNPAGQESKMKEDNKLKLVQPEKEIERAPDIVIITFDSPKFIIELTMPLVPKQYPSSKILIYSVFRDKKSLDKIIRMGIDGIVFKNREDHLEIIKAIETLKANGKYFGKTP